MILSSVTACCAEDAQLSLIREERQVEVSF